MKLEHTIGNDDAFSDRSEFALLPEEYRDPAQLDHSLDQITKPTTMETLYELFESCLAQITRYR
jgi:hypothetical protein